jgi:uncharacterized membrane protein YgcG
MHLVPLFFHELPKTKVVIVLALCIISTAAVISCKSGGPTQQAGVVTAAASPSVFEASGYVIDSAKVLDESTRKQLETMLAALHERKKIDFSVVTVRTTGNKSVFNYSLELARERKNNREANVSGLLLLVAVDDRNWHIQITRNLEKDLTNEFLTNLSAPMTDSFRQNQYGEGILKYVNAIIAKLEQMELAANVTSDWKVKQLLDLRRFVVSYTVYVTTS